MNNISKYRAMKGLTQNDLAEDLNVTSGAVGMWETGKRVPNLEMAKVIADYFNVTIEEIFFTDENNETLAKEPKAS
ncbi:helix-turn-helix transcriptional regulator [Acetobacterium wieringae]|uniref:helix-turn-helix transcriptional regulator n=1 Tax=Acetobacterium wieringae TaxID=52694 RepID=UPI00203395F1|nr:helix-turn-helix transcriptional regulator [Acetobacterium wieringae]URN83517.1 helix-turn-helix transcriptional regulator [Acetobacterium wieringae]